MKKLISTFFLLILFLSLASVLSLPSSTTKETGNVCEIGHAFSYNYNFVYNNSLTIGTYSNFDVSFVFSGDRKLLQNPYIIDVILTPTGAELTSTSFSLNQGFKSIQIKPLTNNPIINVKTILTLNGNDIRHGGYVATYTDTFKITNLTASQVKNSSEIIYSGDDKQITQNLTTTNNTTSNNISVIRNEPSKVPWYIVRLTGLISFLFLSLVVSIALLKKVAPAKFAKFFKYHCELSYLAIIFSLMHGINNLLDNYYWSITLKQLFLLNFSSKTNTLLSLGVISFYLFLVVIITSFSSVIAFLKRKKWYFIHLISYLLYIFVIIHSLFLGTDLSISNISGIINILSLIFFFGFSIFNLILFVLMMIKKLKKAKQ